MFKIISRVLVIAAGGLLVYSKSFVDDTIHPSEDGVTEGDLLSGFLSAINNFAIEIRGGKITSLNFHHFNIVFTYDNDVNCMFALICNINDIAEEVRNKAEMLKEEFLKRFRDDVKNWTGEITVFEEIDNYVEENIFIPPKILLVGEDGVGKTTIMNLFPGETVLELDEDLNEIIQKSIYVSGLNLKQFIIREIEINDFIDNSRLYRSLLDNVEVICLVTNSGASNLGRTKKLFNILKKKVKRADFYIIANFQDIKEQAFEPSKIEEAFGIKTFGFSARKSTSKEEIFKIVVEILNTSILDKIKTSQQEVAEESEN